jgi:hypothetical protein
MTEDRHWHPDLLRRFVPTPYVFNGRGSLQHICVESNDLEIAIRVRRFAAALPQGDRNGKLFCKLVRDTAYHEDSSEISILTDGAVRMLHQGRGTILIYDEERSELLGFVARNVRVETLVSSLIPAILSAGDDR